VKQDARGVLLENFIFAMIVAFLGLAVTVIIQTLPALRFRELEGLLASQVGETAPVLVRLRPPAPGAQVYRWKRGGEAHFGTLLPYGEEGRASLVFVRFSSEGLIEGIARVSSGKVGSRDGATDRFAGYIGKGAKDLSPADLGADQLDATGSPFATLAFAHDLAALSLSIASSGGGTR